MDEFSEFGIPVEGDFHLKEDIVSGGLKIYDSVLILSHFKGHVMANFGCALKNISIRIGTTNGKTKFHTSGKTTHQKLLWVKIANSLSPPNIDFTKTI